MDFCISLAGVKIGIHSICSNVYSMCKNYLCNGAGDFCVCISEEDIAFERLKALREAVSEGRTPVIYPDTYLETLAVYRKIAVGMLDYQAFLMHGAVVGLDGEAYLFTAPSGVGKTTHIRLWLENIPGSFIVNGDKPILRLTEEGFIACGTPWSGKENMHTNTQLPLKAIVLLERGRENAIAQVDFLKAYPMLIQQIYRPASPDALGRTLTLLNELGASTPMYRLRCNMDPEAALVACRGVREGGARQQAQSDT